MADEVLRAEAAHDLIQKLCEERFGIGLVDRIVGPQTGATLLAEALAKEISSQRKRSCEWASPAKAGTGENRWMVFDDPERKVLPDERILLCEDVTTTGESVGRAASACDEAEGMLLRYVLILVNRSGLKEIDGRKPIALIDREMYNWKPDECPLCAQGSEAIRPRDPESNWARLIANY